MKERRLAIDLLKIIATLMVVMLHVNGYLNDTVPFEEFSFSSSFIWHLTEAFAYPAIHLFVIISAFLLIEKGDNSIFKSGLNSWLQTWIVSVVGLVLAVAFKVPFGLKDAFSSVFPFLGRAYWYVSDAIALLLLMPILNRIVNVLNQNQLKYLIITMFGLISVLPTFLSMFNWTQDYSNIGLFLLLYFAVAYIKKHCNNRILVRGGQIWLLSLTLLFGSWLFLHQMSSRFPAIAGREMIFYQYCSPFVIGEALGLFLAMFNMEKMHKKRLVGIFSNASLVIYLIHMHPIFKNQYVAWNAFGWINVSNPAWMAAQLLLLIMSIYLVGVVISVPVIKISTLLVNKVMNMRFCKF